MPGVSNRGPVSAADGFGKVYLKFRVKKKRTHYLGAFIYSMFFSLIFFVFAWTRPQLKNNIVLPFLRRVCGVYENILQFDIVTDSSNFFPRNDIGVPFLSGSDYVSVIRKQGFVHAHDRFLQMEIYRLTFQGKLSELFGYRTVEIDKLALGLNFMTVAQLDLDSLDELSKSLLDAYSEGVNEYISKIKSATPWKLPLEFAAYLGINFVELPVVIEQWQSIHTLGIMRLTAYQWNVGWEDELIDILGGFSKPSTQSEISKHLLPSLGGHAIAIMGKHAQTDGAILAGGVESLSSSYGQWYLNSLQTPSTLVTGASIPGIPLMFMGRNQHIAWTFTPSAISNERIVSIEVQDGNDRDTPFTVRDEVIKVRHNFVGNETFVPVSFREYRNANDQILPLLDDVVSPHFRALLKTKQVMSNNKVRYVLDSPALTQRIDLKFLVGLAEAQNLNDFISSCDEMRSASLNVLYADTQNNIGSLVTGVADVVSSQKVVQNPGTGYLIATTVPASSGSSDAVGRLEYLIQSQIAQENKFNVSTLKTILMDVYSPSSVRLASLIRNTAIATDDSMSLAVKTVVLKSKEIVREFDGMYTLWARAPVFIEAFRVSILNRLSVTQSDLSHQKSSTIKRQTIKNERFNAMFVALDQMSQSNRHSEIASALHEAYTWCEEHYGSDSSKWTWGAVHSSIHLHPSVPTWYLSDNVLSRGPAPLSGTFDSIHRSDYAALHDIQRLNGRDELFSTDASHESSLRLVMDMAADTMYAVTSTGQSSHLGSKWYGHNALENWSKPAVAFEGEDLLCCTANCLSKDKIKEQYCSEKNDASKFISSGCVGSTKNEL